MLFRALSWLWPLPVAREKGLSGDLTVRWERGRKVLNSTHANQSFGALHRVWQQTLARVIDPGAPPRSILLLGYGGGSVAHILRHERRIHSPITAVEWDPAMLQLARTHFDLDGMGDLRMVTGDATVRIHAMKERFDLVLVDLFDDLDLARGVDSSAFLHGLRDRCDLGAAVCFNTVSYDEASETRCQAVHDHAVRIFHTVEELRAEDLNRMFILR